MSVNIFIQKSGKQLLYDPSEYRIRSFVKRAGRLSGAQARALEVLGPQYCLRYCREQLNLRHIFGNDRSVILEIGFGMGEATAKIATANPDKNFLGVEVHTPGVGSLLKKIAEEKLQNIRILQHDVVEVLRDMLAENSLAGVHIFFPDPWHKAKHNKRRLIQAPFIDHLTKHIKSGGYLHCATDWEGYAFQMLEVLSSTALLENSAENFATKPDYRPTTKFENRGLGLGHNVWDLVFTKK